MNIKYFLKNFASYATCYDIPITIDDFRTIVMDINETNPDCNNFAIQDRDISTVDIYILDYVQYMDELKGPDCYNNNENKPEE